MRALLFAVLMLVGCGGGTSVPMPSEKATLALPAFTRYSTDFAAHPAEGTIGEPLKVADPRCRFLPYIDWQQRLCMFLTMPVWTQSNALATTLDDFRWRVIMNLEGAWETNCNTGPPGQSLPINQLPIVTDFKEKTATIGFELANESALCSKIPYVALTYIRGVQGDGAMHMASWGAKPVLSFDGTLTRTIGPTFAQAVHFWVHLRTTDGTRYMAHTHLWQSGYEPPDFRLNWNWPAVDSYYFPGAWIHGGDSETCPPDVVKQVGQHWTIDLEALSLCRFPEFATMKPAILGFEIAAEGAYLDYAHPTGLPNRLSFTVSNPSLTLQ